MHLHICKTFEKFTCCKLTLFNPSIAKDMFKAIINHNGEALYDHSYIDFIVFYKSELMITVL